MRKSLLGLLLFYMAQVAFAVCMVAPLLADEVKVASHGVTDIHAMFGKNKIVVKIITHEVDIGKASDERPQKIFSSCTYSKVPCSVIDYVGIIINGNSLFVARSVFADLADVGIASLRQKKKCHYILTLSGGDASESYTVEVTFDNNTVKERTRISNEAGEVTQKTTYFPSQSMEEQ